IRYTDLRGAHRVHVLVPTAGGWLVSAGGWLYWGGHGGISRIRPDGTQLTRRVMPKGNALMGLATDGHYLYFSDCSNAVGRVELNGRGLDPSFIRLPRSACPVGLAVGDNHVYWTEDWPPASIGRATLQGTHANDNWLALGRHAGES